MLTKIRFNGDMHPGYRGTFTTLIRIDVPQARTTYEETPDLPVNTAEIMIPIQLDTENDIRKRIEDRLKPALTPAWNVTVLEE